MIEYTYAIEPERGTTWKSYVAQITGKDPNYILSRDFKRVHYYRTYYGHSVSVMLQNGLFEVCISRFDAESGERMKRKRWWIVITDDDIYEYEFEELNWQYALFTAFNIRVNYGFAAWPTLNF